MKNIIYTLLISMMVLPLYSQERTARNKPYIDLRPLHFGILVGVNFQDAEFENVGPQTITVDGGTSTQTILCDVDSWNPGFSVGVVADYRISEHLSARLTPTMHFGAKHLTFRTYNSNSETIPTPLVTQDLKNTYISFPLDIKFSAKRYSNYRPYIMTGLNTMVNLTGKDQDFIRLKRFDTFAEVGLGCDLYLPFFKLIPELKFCYSLTNSLDKNHANELQDVSMRAYANAVKSCSSKMIVLTFYFE